MARAVLGADEGIGPAPTLGFVIQIEFVPFDRETEVVAQILAYRKARFPDDRVLAEDAQLSAQIAVTGDVGGDALVWRLANP